MKWVIIIVVLAAIAAGIWWAVAHAAPAAVASEQPATTAKVTRGDLNLEVQANGTVESNLDVEIKVKASGEITTLPYDVSDRVPKYIAGHNEDKALLVALDPINEQRAVQRTQAQYDAANAKLEQAKHSLMVARQDLLVARSKAAADVASAKAKSDLAKASLARTRQMFENKVSTRNELETEVSSAAVAEAALQVALAQQEAVKSMELAVNLRQADVDLAQANLASAKVDLADTQQRLADTRIYSPIDGVVTSRTVQVGQIVASGIQNVGGGTTLMTVSDLSRLFVVAAVDESDIGRLVESGRLGHEVTITADAYPGKRFTGKVVQITPRGASESNVVTFPVKIEVLGEGKDRLRPKMSANVTILANRRSDTLLIPNAALQYDREQTFVEVMTAGKAVRRDVTLGLNDGIWSEVLSGLKEGEEVAARSGVNTRWSNDGRSATSRPATRSNPTGVARRMTRAATAK
ncbi:MAG: efflux RND transporter periplasmic adaptor subunit [Planctomycetaceae bacterium]|nr:efflux RND transporter periplasmic adaptor subunit [Planctomycetaceae bacterium]